MNPQRRNRLAAAALVALTLTAAACSATTETLGATTSKAVVEQMAGTINPERVVKESWPVDTLPEVVPCNGGPDYPNIGGVILDLAPYPSPADALFVFVENQPQMGSHPPLATSGYIEMVEPHRAVTFGQEFGGKFVTLISVVEVDGQWAVDEWEASGC